MLNWKSGFVVACLWVVAAPTAGAALVAHWVFDGPAPVYDQSGQGHVVTGIGDPYPHPHSIIKGGWILDGDDAAEVPDDDALDLASGALTIAAWVRARSFGENDQGRILDKRGHTGPSGWSLGLDAGSVEWSTNGATSAVSGPVIEVGEWHHVVVTQTGGLAEIYVDGNLVASQSGVQTPLADIHPVRVGMRATDSLRTFNGWIDDVRIYDGALSSGEVEDLHDQTGPAPSHTWPTATPEEVGLDFASLDALVAELGSGAGVIVRGGRLVYSWGCQACKVYWASAGKTILSSLLWLAVEEGRLSNVDDLIFDWGWALTPADQSMTFRHLAHNLSGYARAEDPGDAWAYNDYGIALYQQTLFPLVYGTTDGNAVARDAGRLGALDFDDGPIYSSSQGASGYALVTTPRDFARFGQWILQRGFFNGSQLVPAATVDAYLQDRVPGSMPLTTGADSDYLGTGTIGGGSDQSAAGPGVYGFNWWHNGFPGGGPNRLWPDAPPDTIQANGHWNESVLTIIPSLDLVAAWQGDGDFAHDFVPRMNPRLALLAQSVVAPVEVPVSRRSSVALAVVLLGAARALTTRSRRHRMDA